MSVVGQKEKNTQKENTEKKVTRQLEQLTLAKPAKKPNRKKKRQKKRQLPPCRRRCFFLAEMKLKNSSAVSGKGFFYTNSEVVILNGFLVDTDTQVEASYLDF